jgi:hypothetical protein
MAIRISLLLVSVAIILSCVPQASACLNDREVKTYEREFRSHYMDKDYQPLPREAFQEFVTFHAGPISLVGFCLLFGATLLGGSRRRPLI